MVQYSRHRNYIRQYEFFDAGGTSLLLAELKNKTDQEFGTELSVVELMTYTNISSMAEYISTLIS